MHKSWLISLVLFLAMGSIGATFITPVLPSLMYYFNVSSSNIEHLITYYLFGYCFGQLIYGPISNRFNVVCSLKIGIFTGIIGCVLSMVAIYYKSYNLMLISRVIVGLGFACGTKVTFTIVNKVCEINLVARVLSFLTIAFAIVPSFGVLICGYLAKNYNYITTFYFMIIYASVCYGLSNLFTDVKLYEKPNKLKLSKIIIDYFGQLQYINLVLGGVILGAATSIIYVFASFSSIIAMNYMGINANQYGLYNLIPTIGIYIGVILSNKFSGKFSTKRCLIVGFLFAFIGILFQWGVLYTNLNNTLKLFIPMIPIYIGLSFIFGNSSAIGISGCSDKSNASAMFSFINLGFAFVGSLLFSKLFVVNIHNLILINLIILIVAVCVFLFLVLRKQGLFAIKSI